MKRLIPILMLLLTLVSCNLFPPHLEMKLSVRGNSQDIYWQLLKDGDTDDGHYSHYPVKDMNIYDIEQGQGYTVRMYIVTETIIEDGVEKRIIGDTYETHFVIDHWETTLSVTYTEEEGLGCSIRKEGNID